MKNKIILIVVVIFVSLGLVGISKIAQDKYLNKKDVLVTQKANNETVNQVAVKTDVKPTIVDESVKAKIPEKSVAQVKTDTAAKTKEKDTQTKPKSNEVAVVPTQVVKEEVTKTPQPPKQPNLIIKDDITGKIILSINISTENKTVGEITLNELDNRGINYSAQGRGEAVYFTMINNLKARGDGPLSGWCYYVNGSKPGVSCGAYKLKADDVVEWRYLKDGINN